MNRWTTVLLLVVVAALGVATWVQSGREDPDYGRTSLPLFENLDPRRLTRIRWERLEGGDPVGMQRDEGGRWYLTDPIAYPVRAELLAQLLKALGNQAQPVPAAERELAEGTLDPPRFVLALTEVLPSGEERRHELEMGDVDLDNMRVFVRTRGRLLRTPRNLETALENSLTDWRSRSVFGLDPTKIVEIHREGFEFFDGQKSMWLTASRLGRGWRIDHPIRIQADPALMDRWSRVLGNLSLRRFLWDLPDADLSRWGLDEPWFTLELVDASGNSQTLLVNRYTVKRTDLPYVWELDPKEYERLRLDLTDAYDAHLARVFRSEVDLAYLVGERHSIRLTHDRVVDRWTVSHRDPTGEWTVEAPANREGVERVLRVMEQEEIVDYLWDDPITGHFPEDAPRRGVWLESDGIRYGGRIGPRQTIGQGVEVFAFLRDGESRVALVPPAVAQLLELEPLDLESLAVLDLKGDTTVERVTLTCQGQEGQAGQAGERVYRRTIQGTWEHADVELEATEVYPIIDHLFPLMAERHLGPEELADLSQVVTVLVDVRGAERHQVEVGVTAEGQARVRWGNRQSVLLHPELHALLLEVACR